MSDKKVAEFTIEGDPDYGAGKGVYRMQFDFNEVVRAEKESGLNLFVSSEMTAGQARALVCASLRTHHPQVTIEEAGALLTRAQRTVMEALAEIYDPADVEE